jgi:hypothetical protein
MKKQVRFGIPGCGSVAVNHGVSGADLCGIGDTRCHLSAGKIRSACIDCEVCI